MITDHHDKIKKSRDKPLPAIRVLNIRSLFFLCFVAAGFLTAFGQKKKERDTSTIILQPDRIEFKKADSGSDFYVIPGSTNGLLVAEETSKSAPQGGYVLNIHLIDTAFNVVWSRKDVISNTGSLIGYEYFGGSYYLLFNRSQYKSEQLLLLQYSVKSEEVKTYELTTVFPMNIEHFESVEETLLLAGYANYRPVVITYNINERIPKIVPGFYDNKNDILDLVVDEKSRLFTVVMSERMRNKKYTVRVKSFSDRGDLIQDNLLDPGEKKSLIDGATTTFSGGLQYLAGTHARKSSHYSQGFYLSKFTNGRQQFNKYYPFAALSNFWDHLKPKREERILRRIERKKEKGKVKKFNYRLLVHEIIQKDEEYIMVAEAYYPRYNNSSDNPFGRVGNFGGFQSSRTGNPYFLGYKYTHAVVVGFDRNCNIIWDHTFKIEDKESFILEENVTVNTSGDKVVLMYLEGSEIRSKVIERGEIVEGRTFNPVKLSYDTDELRPGKSSLEKIERWYNDASIAYGEQTIKNEKYFGKTSRRVFYINKIKYSHGHQPD